MRIVPDNYRVSCRITENDSSIHGHRFKSEMILMPSERNHRVLPYIEYYDAHRRKLKEPCEQLPVMPALFDRNIDQLLVNGPILKIVIDNKVNGDVSVIVKVISPITLCSKKKKNRKK